MYTCRECEQPINQATEICPYCGADLTVAPEGMSEEAPQKRSAAKLILLYGLLLAGLFVVFWFSVPQWMGNPVAQGETSTLQALSDVHAALAVYAKVEGEYPPSLETIADRVRASAQSAQREGYQLAYTPGAPGEDGRVHTYTLLARPGNYGYRNFFVDETGVVRATRENRPANAQDPPP